MYNLATNRFSGESSSTEEDVNAFMNQAMQRASDKLQTGLFEDNRAYQKAQELREQIDSLGMLGVQAKEMYDKRKAFKEQAKERLRNRMGEVEDAPRVEAPTSALETPQPAEVGTPAARALETPRPVAEQPAASSAEIIQPSRSLSRLPANRAVYESNLELPLPLPREGPPVAPEADLGEDLVSFGDNLVNTTTQTGRLARLGAKAQELGSRAAAGISRTATAAGEQLSGAARAAGELGTAGYEAGSQAFKDAATYSVNKATGLAEKGYAKYQALDDGAISDALGPAAAGFAVGESIPSQYGLNEKASVGIGAGIGAVQAGVALAQPELTPFIIGGDLLAEGLVDIFHHHKPDKGPKFERPPLPKVTAFQRGDIAAPTKSTLA